jgi:deoxyribodipyrimidine photo-lyase
MRESPACHLVWLRNDLRLHDHPAIFEAAQKHVALEFVYVFDERLLAPTAWGFARIGRRRLSWLMSSIQELHLRLQQFGHTLYIAFGNPVSILSKRLTAGGVSHVFFNDEPGFEEQHDANQLKALASSWGIPCSVFSGGDLFSFSEVSHLFGHKGQGFTPFRQKLEQAGLVPTDPLSVPDLNLCSSSFSERIHGREGFLVDVERWQAHRKLSFDFEIYRDLPIDPRCDFSPEPGEVGGLNRLHDYLFGRRCIQTYKDTRNGMLGSVFSTRFSPWMAVGSLSTRLVWAESIRFEESYGRNDGSAWLRFELLWREYFRQLSRHWGRRMFLPGGATSAPFPWTGRAGSPFEQWCRGKTGHQFIDAHMNELLSTGWMSNRGRQVVASYLVHQLKCDWRAGAAWFEHQLIDYDVASNYGNWTYLAGVGTDPRHNRVFNPDLQADRYDPLGAYRQKWSE